MKLKSLIIIARELILYLKNTIFKERRYYAAENISKIIHFLNKQIGNHIKYEATGEGVMAGP